MRQITCALVLVSLGILGCAAPPADDGETFDPDSKADGSSTTPLKFFGTTVQMERTVAGFHVTEYKLGGTLTTRGVSVLDGNAAYSCVWADAAKVAPADLQQIVADPNKLMALAAAVGEEDTEPVDDRMSIEPGSRATVFADFYHLDTESSTLEDWPQATRTVYKAALRIVVRSMLSSPTARVYRFTYSPDWTDDTWIAVDPVRGEVKMLTHGGDC